jgi:threonine synthase
MTTILDDNVHCLSVSGNFDDCQDAVKAMFRDLDFKRRHNLAAINSINWARILAQIVYYFRAYFAAAEQQQQHGGAAAAAFEIGVTEVAFAVPTGNFGNILAGWYAQQMGLPVSKLVLATNDNDILHRFFTTGVYAKRGVRPTISPSMDIQVASNFERFVYHMVGRDPARVSAMMAEFAVTGELRLADTELAEARGFMVTHSVSETETTATIRRLHADHGYLACPHSAIGLRAAEWWAAERGGSVSGPVIALATAHAGKFGDAVEAATGEPVVLPRELASLLGLETRVTMVASADEVPAIVAARSEGAEVPAVSSFAIRVPASTANLGAGYDALGLALGLYLDVHVSRGAAGPVSDGAGAAECRCAQCTASGPCDQPSTLPITLHQLGEGADSLPPPQESLLIRAAAETYRYAVKHLGHTGGSDTAPVFPPLTITCRNGVPLSRGLGSSSACTVAGVLLATRVLDLPHLSPATIVAIAAEIEGHGDNAAAAGLGGLTVYVDGSAIKVPVDTF